MFLVRGDIECRFRAGIDGRGVFKEFIPSLRKEVFDSDRGLWLTNKQNELYPNPSAESSRNEGLESGTVAAILLGLMAFATCVGRYMRIQMRIFVASHT